MPRTGDRTHFGFQDIPLDDKQARVDSVFHSVAHRYDVMTRGEFERGLAFLDAVHDAAQLAFAESVAVWLFDAMEGFVKERLADEWSSVEGFDDHVGIMAFRIAHHYLTGGWSTEDTAAGRPQGMPQADPVFRPGVGGFADDASSPRGE